VIFYDTNLAPVATYLKVGVMQLILAMIEAGHVDHNLLLEKPLNALHEGSRDPDLKVHMSLLSGQMLTAVDLQLKFLEQARAFEARYGFEGIVPGAKQIMELWEDTLLKLHSRAFVSLHGRIDWLMKRALCEQALVEHPGWSWGSPEVTHLDQIYASIDPADSMFLSLDAAGLFEPVATEDEIVHFVSNPPENTRAWTRAMLLRAAGPARVAHVDWDKVEFKSANGRYLQRRQIGLPVPTGATRSACESLFSEAEDFSNLLDLLRANDVITEVQDHFSPGSAVSQLDSYRFGEYNQPQPGDSNE
jgi:proteasome accessory factor A